MCLDRLTAALQGTGARDAKNLELRVRGCAKAWGPPPPPIKRQLASIWNLSLMQNLE